MSVDMGGNLDVTPEEPKRKTRSAGKAKVRRHLLTTTYKQDVAEKLDKLYAAGHTILAITGSTDVRGFEIISYNEE
jgi:hypothetical protein